MPVAERISWPAALACTVWFLGFAWGEPRATLLAAPFVLVGALLLHRHLAAGSVLVLAAGAVTLLTGSSWGGLDLVLPFAVVLFTLGRAAPRWVLGLAAVSIAATVSAFRDGFALEKLVVTTALYGTVWAFGFVVRGRAERAHATAMQVKHLAAQDPRVVGARLAAEERGRLAAQAVFALRSAIVGMRETARRAAKELDPVLVREVHERGALAVDELRGLLGLLREPVTTPPPEAPAPRGLEGPPALAATLVPLLCLALAVASVVIAASPPSVPESLLPGAGAYAFASWAVAARPSRAAWASLGVLIAAGVWLSTAYGPHGAGFVLFVIGASAFAGLAWSEGDRILHEARLRGSELQARLDDATATALRAERLRLARELHDVASHSVGAMVLQAGAAGAVRHRDPVQARAALATVVTTSDTALRDVAELLATLETATPDNPSRDSAGPATLRSTIDRLVGTMRADGLDVSIDLAALPRSPSAAATAYRVLHEGLVNAQRHAPGEPVNVTTTREEDRYVVRVSNRMSGPSPAQGAGFGLAGLRERALASGGTLTAGTAGDGSFVLEVRLPLESGATAELS